MLQGEIPLSKHKPKPTKVPEAAAASETALAQGKERMSWTQAAEPKLVPGADGGAQAGPAEGRRLSQAQEAPHGAIFILS